MNSRRAERGTGDLRAALTEVRRVVGRTIRLTLIDREVPDIGPCVLGDGALVPGAVFSRIADAHHSQGRTVVLVTDMPVLGNLFWTYSSSLRTTLCSVHDWEFFTPPGCRCFLLHVAMVTWLVSKYAAKTHHETRGCMLDRCITKSDIRKSLSPSEGLEDEFLCTSCRRAAGSLSSACLDRLHVLRAWI